MRAHGGGHENAHHHGARCRGQAAAGQSGEGGRKASLSGQTRNGNGEGKRTEASVPDTRQFLFQNVTSFGHKARTWLLSDQIHYDIMGVAERVTFSFQRKVNRSFGRETKTHILPRNIDEHKSQKLI